MDKVDENAAVGDEVVVLGNSEGAGVVKSIPGKIVGIGPNLVEVDAPFVPGNSGSPIVHLKTGKVIAIATYLLVKKFDPATHAVLKEPEVRRFGFRLDSVKTWQPVNWTQFFAQAAEIQRIEGLTKDLEVFLMDIAKNHHVTPGVHNNPVIRSRIDAWTSQSTHHLSPADAAMNDQNFISFLKSACQSDVIAARQRLTYDYFQRALENQQQGRNELAEVFDRIIKEIRQQGR